MPTLTKAATGRKQPAALQQTFTLKSRYGLHSRPCALLVRTVGAFHCEVTVECRGHQARATSTLGLMALAAGCDSRLDFHCEGPDAALALAAIRHLFETNFEEAYT